MVVAGFEAERRISCGGFEFDAAAWREAQRNGDHAYTLSTGQKLADCGTLDDRKYSAVVRQLGPVKLAIGDEETGLSKPGWYLEGPPLSDTDTVRVLTVETDTDRTIILATQVERFPPAQLRE